MKNIEEYIEKKIEAILELDGIDELSRMELIGAVIETIILDAAKA